MLRALSPVHRVIELCRRVTAPGPGWTAASMGHPDIGRVSIPGREGLDGSMVLLLTPILFLPGRVMHWKLESRVMFLAAGFPAPGRDFQREDRYLFVVGPPAT